jgi:2-methylcitrate dehydratase
MHDITNAQRPEPDPLLVDIADYVLSTGIDSTEAYDTARLCLMDSLGCMMLALNFPRVHEAARGRSSPARR